MALLGKYLLGKAPRWNALTLQHLALGVKNVDAGQLAILLHLHCLPWVPDHYLPTGFMHAVCSWGSGIYRALLREASSVQTAKFASSKAVAMCEGKKLDYFLGSFSAH